jgi:hypothetical protein
MTTISPRIRQMETKALANGKISAAEATQMLNAAGSADERKAVQQMLAMDGYIAAPAHPKPPGHAHHPDKAGGTKSTGPTPPDQLGHDLAEYEVKPMGEYQTRKDTDAELDGIMSQGHVINGAKTDEEYIVAGNALAHVANNPNAWGKEADVKVMIGGRERLVTVRLNQSGKVEAEVLPDTGKWKPAKSFKTAAAAIAAIQKDFGVTVVGAGKHLDPNWDGNSKAFTAAELEKVYDGLTRLSAAERDAVKGAKLVRINSFVDGSAGMYESGTATVKGTTRRDDRLVYSDAIFAHDKAGFIGGPNDAAPASLEPITHEMGHAVETAEQRKAEVENENASTKANVDLKKPWGEFNKALNKLDTRDADTDGFASLAKDARQALDDLRLNSDPAQIGDLRKAADTAIADAKAAVAGLPEKQKAKAEAVLKALGGIDAVVTKRVDALTRLDATDGANGTQSTRLESFIAMIAQNKIEPFTQYAKDSVAAGKPEEFFAEAFALYKSDPQYLEKNQKAVFDWFKKNVD